MRKLTWAFCLFLSMLCAPALEASPAALIMASTLYVGDKASVASSDVHAWDTPFVLVRDADYPYLILPGRVKNQSDKRRAKAADPDDDGTHPLPAVFKPGHAIDYGGM